MMYARNFFPRILGASAPLAPPPPVSYAYECTFYKGAAATLTSTLFFDFITLLKLRSAR